MQRRNRSNKKRAKRPNPQRGYPSGKDGNFAEDLTSVRLKVHRPLALIMPDKIFTKLKYSGTKLFTVAIGTQVIAYRFRPTSAYDIDPLLGGTSMPGFVELQNLYSSYRVSSSTLKVEANSVDATRASTIVVVPLNNDPGAAPTQATVQSWVANPYAIYKANGTAGASTTSIRHRMSTEKIFGSLSVYFDDNFASLVTTSPVNNWYWAVGIITPAAIATTAYNINVLTDLEMDVEFFNRVPLIT